MAIDDTDKQSLRLDQDGLLTYEYIANHIDNLTAADLDELVDIMTETDLNGQFMASAARYLHAIDADGYASAINRLVAATIDKDREHRYLADILNSLYGPDYHTRAAELSASDNNFRRIYKRVYPNSVI